MKHEPLVREAHHRCSNDMQMVVALLGIMARQADDEGQADILREAANKVRLLAAARSALLANTRRSLASSLRDVTEALQVLAEPRGIVVTLSLDVEPDHLGGEAITAISMAVNELATNALKHAFRDGSLGTIHIAVRDAGGGAVAIIVEDDGMPMKALVQQDPQRPGGSGLRLARDLLARHGHLIMPDKGEKRFEIVLDPAA